MKKLLLALTVSFVLNGFLQAQPATTQNPPNTSTNTASNKSLSLKKEVLFSVGGNLNFIEKAQVSGLYYDVNVFCDPLFNKADGTASRLGIDARLNQGKYVFPADSFINNEHYYSKSDPNVDPEATVLTQKYSFYRSETPTYITLSLSPTYRLSNAENFPLFLAGHFEYIQRKTRMQFETLISDEKTGTFPWNNLPGMLYTFKVRPGKSDYTFRSDNFNYGIGLKYFAEFGNVAVNIKPVLGWGSNGGSKGLFYLTHFEVIEREFGFKIGGELRGIFQFKSIDPTEKENYEPYVALYFAKTFKFSKLLEVLKLS